MDACPDGAINRENKYLKVDGNRCTMCGICADVCPKGVIRIPREGGALICDLCDGDPQCVIWCARGALTLLGAKLEREVEQVV
jgi:Fe-S-cluster-containing hydrogenase component 2